VTTKDQVSTPKQYEYKAEMKRLLHLIAHSLYTHPEVFLRELISNASDALNKVRIRALTDREFEGRFESHRIEIVADKEAGELRVSDNGIGMTREDLVDRLGTVASSGTLQFLEHVQSSGDTVDAQLIGQFGVGFYAAFMVADEIEVETRAAGDDSVGYRWSTSGEGTFTVEEIERDQIGTTVTLHLTEEHVGFAEEYRVREIIKKYSNFVPFPIFVGGVQVNKVQPLWRKKKDDIGDKELEEFYKFVANDYASPLGHLHLELEGRVNMRALLFVPSSAPPDLFRDDQHRGLHLYSNNVFIQDDNRDLLPDYLKFVRGVVDTEDLPLNVSREVTQASPAMSQISTVLTGKILGLLEQWSASEPETFEKFTEQFGSMFKTGVASDSSNKERIVGLLRYESTRTLPGEATSLTAYTERMHPDQTDIYYVLGANREVADHSPNLEYFRSREIEVLFFTDPVDVFTVPHLGEFGGHPFVSVEKADIKVPDSLTEDKKLSVSSRENLLKEMRLLLTGKVQDVRVSRRLVDSVATLVAGDAGLDAQTERVLRMIDRDYVSGSRILEINASHDLVVSLARVLEKRDMERFKKIGMQIFEGTLLLDGNLDTPADFVQRMTDFMVEATRKDVLITGKDTSDE
jgi:molecular chaperone HtpG